MLHLRHTGHVAKDWVDDETMSSDETLKRFAALKPQPTRGPKLPAGGYLVHSYGSCGLGSILAPQGFTARVVTVTNSAQPVGV